jgi:hypothetical protein
MRLVWTWSTGTGGGVIVRRAWAAAEAERFAWDARLLRKAWVAALWADAEAAVWGRLRLNRETSAIDDGMS